MYHTVGNIIVRFVSEYFVVGGSTPPARIKIQLYKVRIFIILYCTYGQMIQANCFRLTFSTIRFLLVLRMLIIEFRMDVLSMPLLAWQLLGTK